MIKVESKMPPALTRPAYPYLGILDSSDLIVLFTSNGAGVVLGPGVSKQRYAGEYDDALHEPSFTPFHGTVTLSNA